MRGKNVSFIGNQQFGRGIRKLAQDRLASDHGDVIDIRDRRRSPDDMLQLARVMASMPFLFVARINGPAFRRFQNARKRGCLPERSHSFAFLFQQFQHLRQGPRQNLPSLIPIRLRAARGLGPPLQVVPGNFDQRRVRTQLARNGAMEGKAALIEPLVASERGAHDFILSRRSSGRYRKSLWPLSQVVWRDAPGVAVFVNGVSSFSKSKSAANAIAAHDRQQNESWHAGPYFGGSFLTILPNILPPWSWAPQVPAYIPL
jgi:hypothetical protein